MRSRGFMLVTIAVAAAVLVVLFFTASGSASNGNGSRALEGSWQVRLTPASNSPQFDEFMTFGVGGSR